MMMTRASSESALAISTICRCAIDRFSTMSVGWKSTPSRVKSGLTRACIVLVDELEQAAEAGLASDEHVRRDIQVLEQIELLMHERDASRRRLRSRSERACSTPSMTIVPAVGAMTPPRTLHHRRLAGPVLADQPQHLAMRKRQRHPVERDDARIGFDDGAKFQKSLRHGRA